MKSKDPSWPTPRRQMGSDQGNMTFLLFKKLGACPFENTIAILFTKFLIRWHHSTSILPHVLYSHRSIIPTKIGDYCVRKLKLGHAHLETKCHQLLIQTHHSPFRSNTGAWFFVETCPHHSSSLNKLGHAFYRSYPNHYFWEAILSWEREQPKTSNTVFYWNLHFSSHFTSQCWGILHSILLKRIFEVKPVMDQRGHHVLRLGHGDQRTSPTTVIKLYKSGVSSHYKGSISQRDMNRCQDRCKTIKRIRKILTLGDHP